MAKQRHHLLPQNPVLNRVAGFHPSSFAILRVSVRPCCGVTVAPPHTVYDATVPPDAPKERGKRRAIFRGVSLGLLGRNLMKADMIWAWVPDCIRLKEHGAGVRF